MLAEARRRRAHRARRVREAHRHAGDADVARGRMLRAARPCRGPAPADGPAPAATSRMGPHGMPAPSHSAIQSSTVRAATVGSRMAASSARRSTRAALVAKRAIVGEGGERLADGAAERAPLRVVADGDVHEAVLGAVGLVGRDRRVLVAAARGHAAGREVDAGVIGEQRNLAVEHRDVDVLAAAGALRARAAPRGCRRARRARRSCRRSRCRPCTAGRRRGRSATPGRPCPGWRGRSRGGAPSRGRRSGRSRRCCSR